MVLSKDSEAASDDTAEKEWSSYDIGIILAASVTCVFAISAVSTRRLCDLHFSVIQFYLAFTSFLISAVWILFEQRNELVFEFKGIMPWMEIYGASLCHFVAQVTMTCMNQSINPAIVGMFMYAQVLYAYVIDVIIFDA